MMGRGPFGVAVPHGDAVSDASGNVVGAVTYAPDYSGQAPRRPWPRPGWPSQGELAYVKEAITVLLLVLALPWILKNVVRRPGKVSEGAARQHLKGV